jgi:hypothetical protein
MAPQRWKVSDWKNARLEAYRLLVKGATIYRGAANRSRGTCSLAICAIPTTRMLTDRWSHRKRLTRQRSFSWTVDGRQKGQALASVLTRFARSPTRAILARQKAHSTLWRARSAATQNRLPSPAPTGARARGKRFTRERLTIALTRSPSPDAAPHVTLSSAPLPQRRVRVRPL